MLVLLRRALDRGECDGAPVEDEALEFLAARAGGDARTALSALELACETAGGAPVTLGVAEDALQRRALRYDKDGDQHYDYISAWIKATRGSDPDASLYYLAVMLEGGEDPRFIARRMVILASEDVGNADPARAGGGRRRRARGRARRACPRRSSRSPRRRSTCRWRRSPTRPSARSARRAATSATTARQLPPDYLRSAAYPGARQLGRGEGYDYPHDRPEGVSPQELLPAGLEELRFYEPGSTEPALSERLAKIRRARGR